jgi:tetratricopeptide (TPR) repeat protein/TolB-like protein
MTRRETCFARHRHRRPLIWAVMADVIDVLREGLAPRYEVERQIGAGGMARVYLATEQHPRRPVAIKVLEPDISTRLLYDRFIREVELSSRLNHPHIVPIFAAGEVGNLLYYVMPYIEGESLRQRLLKQGHVAWEEALHLTLDVADALAYAHAQGIVHRDIKPENILLSGGHPVVADFGVARAISAAGGQSLTETGHAVGSPGYMSPEQAMGLQVDARSDIYSLGCVLFELLTGQPPTRTAFSRSVDNWGSLDASGALRGAGTGGVRAMKHAISRALAPAPDDRFATVTDFSAALGGSAHRTSLPQRGRFASRRGWRAAVIGVGLIAAIGGLALALARRSSNLIPGRVVVAAIENRTGDSSLDNLGRMAADWVTQGLTETGLVEVVPSVTVMATSAMPAEHVAGRPGAAGVRALGGETRAQTVVSGAYYRQGDSLRFQIEIADARDGKVLRALDPVVGPAANPLAAVERVRQRVMIALGTLFNPKLAGWAAGASQPPDYRAYQDFVEGLDRFARFDYPGARDHFDRAAAGDSTFSVALIWSAVARLNMGEHAGADSIVRRLERSNRALAPVDRSYLGWVAGIVRGNGPAALESARELARVAPGSDAEFLLSSGATSFNRPREAIAALERVDPDRGLFRGTYVYAWDMTTALHQLGEHRQELKEAAAGRRRSPGQLGAVVTEVRALAALGSVDELRQRLDEAQQLGPQDSWTPGSVALLAAEELRTHGYPEAAREAVVRAITWFERRRAQVGREDDGGLDLAMAYFEAGRLEEARRLLEGLVVSRDFTGAMGRFVVLGTLGAIAAREGKRAEALRFDGLLKTSPERYMLGGNTYQRARIHALLGDQETAVDLLQTAILQGINTSSVHVDLAFASLRDYAPFVELLRPKG